jgi:hypothetical protein
MCETFIIIIELGRPTLLACSDGDRCPQSTWWWTVMGDFTVLERAQNGGDTAETKNAVGWKGNDCPSGIDNILPLSKNLSPGTDSLF